jgi:hypothetical protein
MKVATNVRYNASKAYPAYRDWNYKFGFELRWEINFSFPTGIGVVLLVLVARNLNESLIIKQDQRSMKQIDPKVTKQKFPM